MCARVAVPRLWGSRCDGSVVTTARTKATYLLIADELEPRLQALSSGARVPSEHELGAEYEVSRLTARAALQELERRYLVRRVKGIGTFVARRIPYRISDEVPPSWTETLRLSGAEGRMENLRIQHRPAPWAVAAALALRAGTAVWTIERRGMLGEEPGSSSLTHVLAEVAPDLPERLGAVGSLYRALAHDYGLAPARAWNRVELQVAPAEVAGRLGLEDRPFLYHVEGCNASTTLGRPIELTSTWLRADRLNVVVELSGSGPPS